MYLGHALPASAMYMKRLLSAMVAVAAVTGAAPACSARALRMSVSGTWCNWGDAHPFALPDAPSASSPFLLKLVCK
jgi:hypothetical protein